MKPSKKTASARPKLAKRPAVKRAKPIALVLIDDNRLLREGLTAMILSQPGFKVLAASADAQEALEQVRTATPDVVLIARSTSWITTRSASPPRCTTKCPRPR